jgi:hypothetical protein
MKKNELTHIIREIVAEEVRKELPSAIAEVFQNFTNKKQPVVEQVTRSVAKPKEVPPTKLKQSLRELFEGTAVISKEPQNQAPKKFTKDPILNEILNETRPFSPQERMGSPIGIAAMAAAAQAGARMPGISPAAPVMMESGTNEPAFMRNVPSMVPSSTVPVAMPQVSQAQLLREDHVPLADLPSDVSVLDLIGNVSQAAPAVGDALTKNYSGFLKLMDKKRGKK